MISINLQIVLITLNIVFLFFLLNNIRRYRLELKYTLLWILLSSIALTLAIFPKLLFFISDNIYIETPVNALYLISFVILFVILYNFTVIISKLSNQSKKLTQEVGLLKNELDQLARIDATIKSSDNP
ncbi:DUF2304 domain-containing protein [Paenibacillus anaericanus]|uniref:DUF2304 domain-containing protein n=1 Tax=Paenibacillus anaericanus TaxID=170367 RepID=UPI0027D7D522|nr:DUF2304 domain-containing protein [Paenibacillus anaericanus]